LIAVARYTLLEMSRRRLLVALVLVAVALVAALGIAPYILPGYTTPFQRADLMLQGIERSVGPFLLLTGFAVGMTVIYNDLESGAAVAILAKPLSRLEYAAAKGAAALMTQILVAGALAATTGLFLVFYGATEFDYGAVASYFFAGTANVLILVLALMALTTVLNNIVAAVIGFVAYQAFGAITACTTSSWAERRSDHPGRN
jgi:ABC-type transport system involved in multi-copper enzyme maturation permease subunit